LVTLFGSEGDYSLGKLTKIDNDTWFSGSRDNLVTEIAKRELIGYRENEELMRDVSLPKDTREKIEREEQKRLSKLSKPKPPQ